MAHPERHHACPSCGSSDTLPVWDIDLDEEAATARPTRLCVDCLAEFYPSALLVLPAVRDEKERPSKIE
jgi:hypothetical protein